MDTFTTGPQNNFILADMFKINASKIEQSEQKCIFDNLPE